jgi:peptidoglycan/LPS O-acetylase OafA/YrhL
MALSTDTHRVIVTERQRRPHVAALDGLRGLAVIAVMLFHAGKLRGGFLGVDLFFVLSGFLITSLLLDEVAHTGRVDLVAFWGRRMRRLLPAVLALLVVVTLAVTVIGTTSQRLATLGDGPWVQAYLANWHAIASRTGYWASFDLPRVFGHLWSLAIEEQFYLLWPIVIAVVAWRRWHVTRSVLVACVTGSLFALSQMTRLFDAVDPTRVYVGTDTRMSSLLLGAVFAVPPVRAAVSRWCRRNRRSVNPTVVIIAAVLVMSWLAVDGPTSAWLFHGGLFAHSALAALLVAVCATEPDSPFVRRLGSTPLRVTGELSYGLYLWHWPIFVLLSQQRVGLSGWALLVVRVAASFAAAALSKRLVEDPVRFTTTWARGRVGVLSLFAVSLAVAAIWVVVPRPSAAPAAFAVTAVTLPAPTPASAPTTTVTPSTTQPVPSTALVASSPSSTEPATSTTTPALWSATSRVLMLGDSVAYDEWPAVAAAMKAGHVTITQSVEPGVGLLDINSTWSTTLARVITKAHPDLVIYQASLWDFGTLDEQRAAYQVFTDLVLAHGARLAFITEPPVRADQHNDRLASVAGVMADIAAAHPDAVTVFDVSGAWGAGFAQDVNGDRVPERKPDGVHVCPSGAAMYSLWLLGQMQQRFADFSPAPATEWMTGKWVSDKRYVTPEGVCAALG